MSCHIISLITLKILHCEEAPICHVKGKKDIGWASGWSSLQPRSQTLWRLYQPLPKWQVHEQYKWLSLLQATKFGGCYATKYNQNTLPGFPPKLKTSICWVTKSSIVNLYWPCSSQVWFNTEKKTILFVAGFNQSCNLVTGWGMTYTSYWVHMCARV